MLKRIRELLGKRKKPTSPASEAPAGHFPDAATVVDRPPVKRGPTVAHNPIPAGDLDPDAVKIVRRLTRFDQRAYLVGGCVRDLLLNRTPKDFDVGTSATPRQMKRLFRNCRIIGRRFRLAHIYFQHGKIIEVATFRARDVDEDEDTAGKDILIREDNVFGTPEEDALRRDFTINALFYDVTEGNVIDHTEGLADLRQRLVRTIGDPAIRFREDPIRILRAIKFAARLDFNIETRTAAALGRTRKEIEKAAPPRVLEEIARFGREGASRRSFELLKETKVLDVILPEITRAYSGNRNSWELLLRLFEKTDGERHRSDRPIRIGETFAVLFLPALAVRFGWKDDGSVEPPQGVDTRELVDDTLRPTASRLRIPRREQEYFRQVLISLQRVVSSKRISSSAKRSIQGRECYPDLLWMLDVLAEHYGGTFASTFKHWSGREPLSGPRETTEEAAPKRRRRRRGGRGRGKSADREKTGTKTDASSKTAGSSGPDSGTDSETKTPAKPAKSGRRGGATKTRPSEEMPSPWDDKYFFAALPKAPEDGSKATETAAVDPPAGNAEPGIATGNQDETQPAAAEAASASAPRRRKRRRRRRKRPVDPGAAKTDAATTGAEPQTDDETEQEP